MICTCKCVYSNIFKQNPHQYLTGSCKLKVLPDNYIDRPRQIKLPQLKLDEKKVLDEQNNIFYLQKM